jgi:zinc D-Ala-D-Ala carboxypeptidase
MGFFDQHVTPHFTMGELTVSQNAVRLGLDNRPTGACLTNIRVMALALEEVRELVGGPIVVSSCYRAPLVNRAAGGSDTSAHMWALATDFTRPGMSNYDLACRIRDSKIKFDQLILEFGAWVHLGLKANPADMRGLVQTARGTGKSYKLINGIFR